MALAADDAPWTELWASDPKAVGRLRPLTHAVGRSLAKTAEQHKTILSDTARARVWIDIEGVRPLRSREQQKPTHIDFTG
jgi:hypothetical protein